MITFESLFKDETKLGTKIKTDDYLEHGKHPIVDQGQCKVAGYTNLEDGIYTDVPAVIFGDHTRVIKYIDEPFFLGADGTKILKGCEPHSNQKYLYYALRAAKIPNLGYSRHFKCLKELKFVEHSEDEQWRIVFELDKLSKIISLKTKELFLYDNLIKARFVEMFEGKNMDKETIGNIASFCSRGKSPKYVPESRLKVVNQACIYWDRFKFENVKYNEETYDGDRILLNNDLLICSTGTGTLGRCNIFHAPDNSRYMADSHVTIIRLNNHILPEVFKIWFERPSTQEKLYSDCVSGSTNQIELSKEKLKNISILVPPIGLQKQFATFVAQVYKSKFAVQKSLEKTQLLFDSLMQEYFG